jgi:hypothetical protein
VRQFYAGLRRPVRVGLEVSSNRRWLGEMLKEPGIELWGGDPAKIRKAEPRKLKTDRNNSTCLERQLPPICHYK